MAKECVLYDRVCIECGECLYCDLDPQKICDNCMKCIEDESEAYRTLLLDAVMIDLEGATGEQKEDQPKKTGQMRGIRKKVR